MPAATPRAAGVHTTAAPSRMTRYDSMANTVTLDSDGYPVNQLGERMSQDQIDLTEAHQDQIREGMELLEYRSQDLAALRQRPELRYKNWKDTKKGLVSDEEYQRRLKELSDEYDSVLFAEMAGAKSSNQERKIAKTLKSAAHVGKLALKGMLRSDMFIVEEVVPATVKAGVAGTEYAAHYGRATGLAMRDKVLPAAKEKSIAAGRQARYLGQTIMAALVEVRPSSIMRNAAMPSQIQEQNSQARTSGRRANARKLKQARTASTR